MKKELFKFIFIALIIPEIFFLSCSKKKIDNNIRDVPEYIPDIVWKTSTESIKEYPESTQVDNFLYFLETDSYSDFVRVSKIDLESGNYVWKSGYIAPSIEQAPVKCGDYVFVYRSTEVKDNQNYFFCIDDKTGKLVSVAAPGNDEEDSFNNRPRIRSLISVDDKYLCWTNGTKKSTASAGILKLDISKINQNLGLNYVQYVNPDVFYDLSENELIYTHLLYDKGCIYFQTYAKYTNDISIFSKIGCIDFNTGNLKWVKENKNMPGRGVEAFYIIDEKENKRLSHNLYDFEYFVGSYNLKNGKKKWEKIQDSKDLLKEPYIGGVLYNYAGVTYKDGFFYYTTVENWSNSNNKELLSNIKCIKASNGKFVWGFMPENSASLSTKPIVSNGKVFVLSWEQGLWVFDAKTGEVIGVDKNVMSGPSQENALWNDNVIFFDGSTLTCIRP